MPGLRLSEVVLRTTAYDRLCDFYSMLLAQPRSVEMAPPRTEDPDDPRRICFFDFYFDPPYTRAPDLAPPLTPPAHAATPIER
jgi:hypothetical protein